MPTRSRIFALAGLAAAFALPAAVAAQGVSPVTPAAETQFVRQAAFALWWPEYERLMREFIRNTPEGAGQIAVPEPDPDDFFREIEIVGRVVHPAIERVSLYSVSTEGDLFQALFVVSRPDRVWPLVNRVDPLAFSEEMANAYVEATNALLDRHGVRDLSAEDAMALARFTVEVFYNFDFRYAIPASVDSLTFAELNRVRVLRSTDDIPQGLRRFDAHEGEAILYGKIPDRVRGTVTPPRIQARGPGDYEISFYSWHPQAGELKRWEVRLVDGQFRSLKDQTVEKWVSFTVEQF
ncbi:MAG TPA: hypothetical protein VM778_12030 [Gemmatimonadota bacterium]|nr:hypothetical protein [Gemmatimonadota bacterium]